MTERVWTPLGGANAVNLLVLTGFVAATLYRLSFFGGTLWPLNDGALFVAFVEALARQAWPLPDCITFNGNCLPFGYPPLAFMIGAGVVRAGGDAIAFAAWYPALATSIYTLLGLVLLRRLLARDLLFVLAATVFLLHARSYEWLIMGGGISRSTGAVFFALACLAAARARMLRGLGLTVAAGLAVGGAILSHLEWGITSAAAVSLFYLIGSEDLRRDFMRLCLAGAVSAAAIAPWVVTVLTDLGPEPFRNAGETSNWNLVVQFVQFVSGTAVPRYLTLPAMAGLGLALWHRRFFWPALLLVIFLLTPRHHSTAVALPIAVLAGMGLTALIDLLLYREQGARGQPWVPKSPSQSPVKAVLKGLIVLYSAAYIFGHQHWLKPVGKTLEQLSADVHEAAAWARDTLPPNTLFAITSGEAWADDEVSEWFPLLSGQVSISTVQGTEWLADKEFRKRSRLSNRINFSRGCDKIFDALHGRYASADYLLDSRGFGCFGDGARFEPVFASGDVTIYKLHRPGA